MKLRQDSILARLYFWHLRFNDQHNRAVLESQYGSPTDLCSVVRRVFVYLPIQLGFIVAVSALGVLLLVCAHLAAGWVVCVGVYGGLAILVISFTLGHFIAKLIPSQRAERVDGTASALIEWAAAKKRRMCPLVEWTR